ncbi:hypothetical protein A2276_01705 [candidate division WOR-1 bacterium RIFOXYA12_FULL_43_27]|uniref:Prepilin leader peptidase/N-methyltransferase n=1 Tax=candidate division WOR-1 bacterium RIFOXYC2_FULL_46_14 TaxID=1802587 RepID=A0A1F4U6M1_UNCSA|nr:MAG: hypothetical protein A2276_01705 [candidate division WOR-1 bacterium RIFOXYA12_FULL_43_27]OGC19560.1 MAG: hypothetical protein A2292_02625 [candidate division WOR-1 bacterium RIFOXYB2_FULL_46_45]OGC30548.1 MAG: hypothetical protein A2232_02625 [candidate division WOR-1 bacterium RIFOXYA2_FULL_46_56]OGC40615.1 MAG: hypothetical protein A2438_06340 [candidate division WOR-1 bacterium RIFOXYC2_FULL_46_14]
MLVNLLVFALGAMLGSFLNVCIYRLPREESVIFPASHCPKCGRNILPLDNIPVLSWLILGGKCRFCKEKISARYPLVELITAVSIFLLYQKFGLTSDLFFFSVFASVLIVGFFTDLAEQIIPDEIVIVGLIAGFSRALLNGSFFDSLFGAASGFAVFFIIEKLAKIIFKKEGLGFGDVKLAAMLGAFLGAAGFWHTFVAAYVLGAIVSVFLLVLKIKKMGDYIPFGPFLIIGALLVLAIGW